MADVVLGHPYSGALYAYFSDELGGERSHVRSMDWHEYYKTLYGADYDDYVELALTFLLLYDHVWITPADSFVPRSKERVDDSSFIYELRLHVDFEDFRPSGSDKSTAIRGYLSDPVMRLLLQDIRLPEDSWEMIIEALSYEAGLSIRKGIPLLCSPGRQRIISRMVELDRRALHPILSPLHHLQFVETYRSVTGMALRPHSIDDLMLAKPDPKVRAYGDSFLQVALQAGEKVEAPDAERLKAIIRDAIETERISKMFAGVLTFGAALSRIVHVPIAPTVLGGAAFGAKYIGDKAGWHQFYGRVNKAIDRANLIANVGGQLERS